MIIYRPLGLERVSGFLNLEFDPVVETWFMVE